MNTTTKRQVISTLLRARRPDLANIMAGIKKATAATLPTSEIKQLHTLINWHIEKDAGQLMGLVETLVNEINSTDGIHEGNRAKVSRLISKCEEVEKKAENGLKALAEVLIDLRKLTSRSEASTVTARKPHFEPSQWVEQYEDEIATLAANNYGPWKNTKEAEQHVKKAIQEYAQDRHDDVLESFKGPHDIQYIVETYMYQDDPDPYNMDPADPKVERDIQHALAKIFGKDWASISGVRSGRGDHMADGDPKAWIVWVEGHDTETAVSLAPKLSKALGREVDSVEPYDHVTIVVHP